MNRNLGREALLLTVPVLLLGAGVVLKMKGVTPTFSWRNPLDPGPLRVEYTPFQTLNVIPLDVSRGFTWKAVTNYSVAGRADVPKSWVLQKTYGFGTSLGISVVYRRGSVWRTAPPLPGKAYRVFQSVTATSSSNTLDRLAVNLKSIPADAEEIRLRGHFWYVQDFKGTIPPGWKPPVGLKLLGSGLQIWVRSKLFDIQIKAPGQPFPAPKVSIEPQIELKDVINFTRNLQGADGRVHTQEVCYVQLHHRRNRNWSPYNIQRRNLHVFDGNGREIDLYFDYGKGLQVTRGHGAYSAFDYQGLFSPKKAQSDIITGVLDSPLMPKNNWRSYKQPLRVEFEVTDGECWPVKIRAFFRVGAGKESQLKNFGASAKA